MAAILNLQVRSIVRQHIFKNIFLGYRPTMDPYELEFDKIAFPNLLSRLSSFWVKIRKILYSLVKMTTVLLASKYTFAVSAHLLFVVQKFLLGCAFAENNRKN